MILTGTEISCIGVNIIEDVDEYNTEINWYRFSSSYLEITHTGRKFWIVIKKNHKYLREGIYKYIIYNKFTSRSRVEKKMKWYFLSGDISKESWNCIIWWDFCA